MSNVKEINIDTEKIKLQQFLKLTGVVGTGGAAKILIQEGKVKVNEEVEYRRGKMLQSGDIVEVIDLGKFIVKKTP